MAPRIAGSSPVALPRTPVEGGTTGTRTTPASGPVGHSGTSSFEGAQLSGWQANDPFLKKAAETLKNIDTPEARRALEMLSKAGTPTKADLDELAGKDGERGLLGGLRGALGEDGFQAASDAPQLPNVLKGFISWMANSLSH